MKRVESFKGKHYFIAVGNPKSWNVEDWEEGGLHEYPLYEQGKKRACTSVQCFREAQKGDFAFFYTSSPRRELAALAKVDRIERQGDNISVFLRKLLDLKSPVQYKEIVEKLSSLGTSYPHNFQASIFSLDIKAVRALIKMIQKDNPGIRFNESTGDVVLPERCARMRDYYVISPNPHPELKKVDEFKKLVFERQVALMGWGSRHQLGYMFDHMNAGDVVIMAQGMNDDKRLYAAGVVASSSKKIRPGFSTKQIRIRKLSLFTDLRGDRRLRKLFTSKCAYGGSQQIPSIYQLKEERKADKRIMKGVDLILMQTKAAAEMDRLMEILMKKKQQVLQDAQEAEKITSAVMDLVRFLQNDSMKS